MSPVPVAKDQTEKDNPDNHEVGFCDTPQFVMASHSSSDSENDGDDEGPLGMGYQMIPQEPDSLDSEEDEDEEGSMTDEVTESPVAEQTAEIDDIIVQHLDQGDFLTTSASQNACAAEEVKEGEMSKIWNEPRQSHDSSDMNQEHAEKIRAAMAGFSLPPVNHPAWSKVIPEEEWKTRLLSKAKNKFTWPPPEGDDSDR